MIIFKRLFVIVMIGFLLLPPLLVSASNNQSASGGQDGQRSGSYAEKTEVVYATLDANGNQTGMYVVNSFIIEEPGLIEDFGPYKRVKNLTDLQDIDVKGDRITFAASDEPFYYQGYLEEKPLPWVIDIFYYFNGQLVSPEEIIGKDGELELKIETKKNEAAVGGFFENYMLQITIPFRTEVFSDIQAEDGLMASAGENKQVTFTVLPEKEEQLVVTADVTGFEMESIEMTALPSSLAIDQPDTDDMTDDMKSLSGATAGVHEGVRELHQGLVTLDDGIRNLHKGSADYQEGIQGLDEGTADVIEGSKSIDEALKSLSESVTDQTIHVDMSELEDLQNGLTHIAGGLKEVEQALADLKVAYAEAYQVLDQSIQTIPEGQISETDIHQLYASGADPDVLDQLIANYEAAQTVKGTYNRVNEAFESVEPALNHIIESIREIRINLEQMAEQLGNSLEEMTVQDSMGQLQEVIQTLSTNYQSFHQGLIEYTNGIHSLSAAYTDLHNGINSLKNGSNELSSGAADLKRGTAKLADSTNDLPDQIKNEMDAMIHEYDKSDYEPVSFVSSKNQNVASVQFVMKTESMKQDEIDEEETIQTKEVEGFWDRLLDLFK